MEIVLKVIIFTAVSAIMSGTAVWFRWNYLKREKKKFISVMKSQKKPLLFFLCAYFGFSVIAIILQQKQSFGNIALAQMVLLWDSLLCMAVIDYKVKKIPNKVLIFALIVKIICILIQGVIEPDYFVTNFLSCLVGMFVGGFIVLTCMLISRGGIGAGDMKLFAVIGLYYKLTGIMSIMMYSLFLAAIFSIFMLLSKKAKMKTTMPMAPFILLGLTVYYVINNGVIV